MSFTILRLGIAAAVTWCPNKKTSTTACEPLPPQPPPRPARHRAIMPHTLLIPMDRLQMVQRKPWSLLPDPDTVEVRRLVDLIRHAKHDSGIDCLYATFGNGTSKLSQAGWADLEEVRKTLEEFAAEKEVIAFANTFSDTTHQEYYLASAAHVIAVQKTGEVNLLGLSQRQPFLANKLKKAGIEMHVFKTGPYKSAGSAYTESKFSRAERENTTDILHQIQNDTFKSIITSRSRQLFQSSWAKQQRNKEQNTWTQMFWEHFLADESSSFPAVMTPYFKDIPSESESSEAEKWHRKLVSVYRAAMKPYGASISSAMQVIWQQVVYVLPFAIASSFDTDPEDKMQIISDPQQIWTQILNEGVFPAPVAQQAGLVDQVLERDPTPGFLSMHPCISLDHYAVHVEQQKRLTAASTLSQQKLARFWSMFGLCRSQDDGSREKETIALLHFTGVIDSHGAKKFVSLCRQIRTSHQTSSENIKCVVVGIDSAGGECDASERMHEALTDIGLPVVISMGNVAMSGGYFVATPADRIFASKNTLTGSIGVIAVRPDVTKMAEKDGIRVEHIKMGDLAGLYDPYHPLTSNMSRVIRGQVERSYDTFKRQVALGRKMSLEQVEAVAQGRVWTGAQAVQNGLCDEIGGLNDAIEFAQRTYCSGAAAILPFPKEDFWEMLNAFVSAPGGDSCGAKEAVPNLPVAMNGSVSSSGMLFYVNNEETTIRYLLEQDPDDFSEK